MAEDKKKSFWKKPEGRAGAVVLVILILLLLGLLTWLVPLVLDQNIIALTSLIVLLGLSAFIFLDKRMRMVTAITFQRLSKGIASWFVDVDPMKILQKRIREMEDNLRQVKRQLNILRSQSHKLSEQILNNETQIDEHLENASKAKEALEEAAVIINANRAARLRESNAKLANLLSEIENLKLILMRMKNSSEIMLSDVRDQVEIKGQERDAILAGNTAMKSAMEILSGGQSRLGEFDSAMEAVADDITRKVGEMEEFMDMSRSLMNSIDLREGIYDGQGLEMLEKFEKKKMKYSKWLDPELSGDRNQLQDGSQRDELDLSQEQVEKTRLKNYYDSLFDLDNEK